MIQKQEHQLINSKVGGKAVEAYNEGGTAGYQKSVLQMQQESKKPQPSNY